MARFDLNILTNNFIVKRLADQSTDCATIYSYEVEADDADNLDISLVGSHENAFYILNGVTITFTDNVSGITFNNSLIISFSVQNSGSPGIFDQSIITIDNNTITGYDQFIETVIRVNDGIKCGQISASKYDDLTDTPADKVGKAGQFVVVDPGEQTLSYTDITPADISYTHTQGSPATVWSVVHNTGKKFCSVHVQDSSGNTVFGDIVYVDANNLTITFNTAFDGFAYIN